MRKEVVILLILLIIPIAFSQVAWYPDLDNDGYTSERLGSMKYTNGSKRLTDLNRTADGPIIDCYDYPGKCGANCNPGIIESIAMNNCYDGYDNDCDGEKDSDNECFDIEPRSIEFLEIPLGEYIRVSEEDVFLKKCDSDETCQEEIKKECKNLVAIKDAKCTNDVLEIKATLRYPIKNDELLRITEENWKVCVPVTEDCKKYDKTCRIIEGKPTCVDRPQTTRFVGTCRTDGKANLQKQTNEMIRSLDSYLGSDVSSFKTVIEKNEKYQIESKNILAKCCPEGYTLKLNPNVPEIIDYLMSKKEYYTYGYVSNYLELERDIVNLMLSLEGINIQCNCEKETIYYSNGIPETCDYKKPPYPECEYGKTGDVVCAHRYGSYYFCSQNCKCVLNPPTPETHHSSWTPPAAVTEPIVPDEDTKYNFGHDAFRILKNPFWTVHPYCASDNDCTLEGYPLCDKYDRLDFVCVPFEKGTAYYDKSQELIEKGLIKTKNRDSPKGYCDVLVTGICPGLETDYSLKPIPPALEYPEEANIRKLKTASSVSSTSGDCEGEETEYENKYYCLASVSPRVEKGNYNKFRQEIDITNYMSLTPADVTNYKNGESKFYWIGNELKLLNENEVNKLSIAKVRDM
ncbi:hypothetical protein ACFLZN_01840 [Nanoarchaeota archaeon]